MGLCRCMMVTNEYVVNHLTLSPQTVMRIVLIAFFIISQKT